MNINIAPRDTNSENVDVEIASRNAKSDRINVYRAPPDAKIDPRKHIVSARPPSTEKVNLQFFLPEVGGSVCIHQIIAWPLRQNVVPDSIDLLV